MTASPIGSLSALLSNQDAVREGIRNGQCHVVSLGPIREALGSRWERNQDAIHDFAMKSFQRDAKGEDLFIKINEIDYFLVQPSRSAIGALSRATALNRFCLDHFLGRATNEDIRVSVIEVAEPEGITARRASEADIAEIDRRAALGDIDVYPFDPEQEPKPEPKPKPKAKSKPAVDRGDDSPPWEAFGTPRKPLRIVLIKRPEGHDLEATYYTEPIWNASRGAVALFQLRSQTYYNTGKGKTLIQPDDWTSRTLGLVAMRRLTHASEMLDASSPQGLALCVPLSLHALAHSSSRVTVVNRLRKIVENPDHQARLFIELEEIPSDVPMLRVSEAVAQIKAFARRVTLRAPSLQADMQALARTGADGIILSLDGETPSARRLQALKTEAKKGGAFLSVDGADRPEVVDLCHATGLREVCGRSVSTAYGERFVPSPLNLTEILTLGQVD